MPGVGREGVKAIPFTPITYTALWVIPLTKGECLLLLLGIRGLLASLRLRVGGSNSSSHGKNNKNSSNNNNSYQIVEITLIVIVLVVICASSSNDEV